MTLSPQELRDVLRRARTIAVVGLSPKPERPSNSVARYLQRQGYRIIPVNPGHTEILGERAYPTLTAAANGGAGGAGGAAGAGGAIDIVDVFRRSEHAGAVVDEAVALHPMLIWLQQGVVDADAKARSEAHGVPLVMDRCLAVEHRLLEV